MTNIYRTTLRELKKRYLNVLKKCFLANLMAFGMVTLATPATAGEDRLYNSGEKTYTSDVTFEDIEYSYSGGAILNSASGDIDFVGKATFTGNSASSRGGAIDNCGTITFGGEATFTNNTSSSSYGGAIYNEGTITFGGDATFTNNTSSSSYGGAIYNYYHSTITFGGEATFTNNSASSSNGGAIYNYYHSTITFGGEATFTGNTSSSSGGAIWNDYGTITFGGDVTFMDNSSSSGGAIWNSSVEDIDFYGDATFTNNYASSGSGGAIFNYSTITFGENSTATFTNNYASSGSGGAIYNQDGDIAFGEDATFTNNYASSGSGGAIYNSYGTITFGGDATFTGNTSSSSGGAIDNSGTITFGADSSVSFSNNKVGNSLNDIYNSGNGTINILGEVKSDIHLESEGGTIGLKAKKTKDTDTDGKITYTGSYKLTNTTLDLSGDGAKEVTIENLTVSGSSTLKWDAEIKDTGDSYSVASDIKNLTATGQFTAGTVNIMGGNKGEWYDVTLTDLYNQPLIKNGVQINYTIDGLYKTKDMTKTGFSVNFVALPKTLGEVLRSTTASTLDFRDYVTVNEGETLNYAISEKDLQNGSMGELGSGQKTIRGATDKASDTVINANGVERLFYLYSGDKLTLENLTIASAKSSGYGGAIYNSYGSVILDNVAFTNNSASREGGAIYNYFGGTITFGEDATFTGNSASSLGNGGAIFNYGTITFGEDATFTGNSVSSYGSGGAIYNGSGTITFGEGSSVSFSNNKVANSLNDIYNSGTINILGEVKSDIHLISSGGTIGLKAKDTDGDGKVTYGGSYNLTSSAKLDLSDDGIKEVTIEKLSGSGASLIIDALFTKETDGSITMTADKLNSENAYQFTGATVKMTGQELLNAILSGLSLDQMGNINPAIEYKTSILGGNATFKSAKTSQLSTTSPYIYQMVTSGQDLTVSATKLANNVTPLEYLANYAGDSTLQFDAGSGGLNASKVLEPLSTGTKTILGASDDATESVIEGVEQNLFVVDKADTILEMKDLSIRGVGTAIDNQAGSVALDNVIIKDTVGDTALKNGSILSLKDVTIDKAVENTGSIVGEGTLALAGLTGSGTLTMNNGVLDVADKFTTSNKVVSNNMKIGDAVKEISFAELEIKAGTTLDIDNKHVTAGKVTFGNESTLSITLNELADYGTLSHDEVVGDENAKLNLKLTNGIDTELGIYQVFNKDNDLILLDNNLLDIIDMGDGSYRVRKKADAILEADLGMSKAEVDTVGALLKEADEGANSTFLKAQEEILEGLQSENKGTVLKAKRALNALGARSTSVYQSQATALFTQMHTVISQMLMNATAGVFGHNGGEEPARATVYIKGLYDRVNSLAGDGFRMRSKGAVLGVQSEIKEGLTVGVGYASTNSIAKEPLRRTDVNANTGFISAQYQPGNWWVNGVATYTRSQYDEEKQVLSSKGVANYDVDSVGAQITTGYNIKLDNWIITPEIGVRYLNARQEGYTDSFGTTVEKTTSDFVTAMAGFKLGADLGKVRPLAGVMVGYDVITDDIASVNTLANGQTFTIKGKALDRLSTTVVAGFAADLGDRATLKLEYSGNYRKEYLDHSGMLRLEWKF